MHESFIQKCSISHRIYTWTLILQIINNFNVSRLILRIAVQRALMYDFIHWRANYDLSQHPPGHWSYTCSTHLWSVQVVSENGHIWIFVQVSTLSLLVFNLLCIAKFKYVWRPDINGQTYCVEDMIWFFIIGIIFNIRRLSIISQRMHVSFSLTVYLS